MHKKLKRNGIKTSTSSVSLFLCREVCHVSDHLARMSNYDSEEWTAALVSFDYFYDPATGEHVQWQSLVPKHSGAYRNQPRRNALQQAVRRDDRDGP